MLLYAVSSTHMSIPRASTLLSDTNYILYYREYMTDYP